MSNKPVRARNWIFVSFIAACVALSVAAAPAAAQKNLENVRTSAEQGDAGAQYKTGVVYAFGKGVTADKTAAVKWWRRAAAQGDLSAQKLLQTMAYYNMDITKGVDEEIFYLWRAAEFYSYIDYGPRFPRRKERAVNFRAALDAGGALEWLLNEAEQGDVDALYNLGTMYFYGDNGVPRDLGASVKWFRIAAEQGDAASQLRLGHMLYGGLGEAKNAGEAVKWWRAAAEQNHPGALYSLGNMYAKGQEVPEDINEAVKYWNAVLKYWKVVLDDNADTYDKLAAYVESLHEFDGHILDSKALGILAKIGVPAAQLVWGVEVYGGRESPKNVNEALKWWGRAATRGDAHAQQILGEMAYDYGERSKKNFSEAIKWWRTAVEQGNAKAQVRLGLLYAKGEGVPKDINKALKLWRAAAEQGNASAGFWLGLTFLEGEEVPKNIDEGSMWLQDAAKLGHTEARNLLDLVPVIRGLEGDSQDGNKGNKQ